MAHQVLTAKLEELDGQLSQLSSWIHLCEATDRDALLQEIDTLSRTRGKAQQALQENLQQSHAETAAVLARMYAGIEDSIQNTKAELEDLAARLGSEEAVAEEKTLLAEYALDFAMQAAKRAVLLSMEAIYAQITVPSKEELPA